MWQICLCALYNATAETGLIAPLAPSPWQQRVARRGAGVLPCLCLYPMVRATLADRVDGHVGWDRERQVRVGRTAVVALLYG